MKLFRSKYFVAVLTLFVVGFIVAQTIRLPQFKGVQSFSIESFDQGVLKAEVRFQVENKNWFSYNGKDLQCDLFYKGKKVASGFRPDKFSIRRKSNSELEMDMTFYVDSLKNDLRDLLMKDSISFDIAVSGKFLMGLRSESEMKVTIASKELVDKMIDDLMGDDGLELEQIRLKEVAMERSLFEVGFLFRNKLPFAVKVEDMKIDVFNDRTRSTQLAVWKFDVSKEVGQGQEVMITGESEVKNKESVVTGIIKVMSGELDYYLYGFATVSVDDRVIRIPIDKRVRVYPLSKKVTVID